MKATATFEKKNNDPKKGKKQSDNKFPFFGKKKDKKKEEDCDDCKKKEAKKKAKKVNETSGIMSFKQFLNESTDFQDQFAPENFETEDDDDSIIPMEGSETETQEDEQIHSDEDTQMAHDGHGHHAGIEDESDDFGDEEVEDTWNTGDDGFGDDDIDDEPVIPKRGASKIEKINNELMSVNNEIGRLLDQYKSDNDIQNYKKQASPLLAQRKELQAQLDAQFNIGGESEDEFSDLEMSEEDFTA